MQRKKLQLSAKYRLWKNQENLDKMVKNGQNGKKNTIYANFSSFFQECYFAESLSFLRCIQCIKTLHLIDQNQQYDNFSYCSP